MGGGGARLVPGAVLEDEAGGGGAQHACQHACCVGHPQQHAAVPRADVLRVVRSNRVNQKWNMWLTAALRLLVVQVGGSST